MKGFGEPPTKLEFYEFGDMTIDGDSPTNRLQRQSMKAEKWKRAWKMGSQNLSKGRKLNRQRKVSDPGSLLVALHQPDATASS